MQPLPPRCFPPPQPANMSSAEEQPTMSECCLSGIMACNRAGRVRAKLTSTRLRSQGGPAGHRGDNSRAAGVRCPGRQHKGRGRGHLGCLRLGPEKHPSFGRHLCEGDGVHHVPTGFHVRLASTRFRYCRGAYDNRCMMKIGDSLPEEHVKMLLPDREPTGFARMCGIPRLKEMH